MSLNIHQHLSVRALINMQHETRAEILRLERAEIITKQPVDNVRLHNLRQTDTEISNAISWLKRLPASIAMLLCLCFLPLMGAEEGALPEDAQELMTSYQEELDAAKAEYDEAVAEATESVIKKLDRELKQQTRRGELAAATAIQEKIQELSETLMLGKDAEPEYPEKILIETSTDIVSMSSPIFNNRGYTLIGLPPQFSDWKIVQQVGGNCIPQKLQANGGMYFYLISADQNLGVGERTDLTCQYTDPGRSTLYIYKVAYRGGVFTTPNTSAFSGVMILVPHAEKR